MNKYDNFDNRYSYYFYGVNNISDCYNIFNDDLLISNAFDRSSACFWSFNQLDNIGLYKKIEEYLDVKNYNGVIVIKIPSYYMGWIHRNGVLEYFVPFIKTKYNFSKSCNDFFIIANLINGFYIRNTKEYVINEKYNPFYDPSGLQFSDEQIRNMYKFGYYNLNQKALKRKKYSYEELKVYDEINHRWDDVIEYYSSVGVNRMVAKVKQRILKRR